MIALVENIHTTNKWKVASIIDDLEILKFSNCLLGKNTQWDVHDDHALGFIINHFKGGSYNKVIFKPNMTVLYCRPHFGGLACSRLTLCHVTYGNQCWDIE